MKELKSLYNAILNDASIQRYSLGWKTITDAIKKRYKTIELTDEQFSDRRVKEAITVSKGNLKSAIEAFARELSINIETLAQKYS